jgi:cell division protein FtsN
VQVASYSTKDNADEARKVLDAKDLPCEVFTFTKDSKLYYRVRVGPYKTESEAEKWKKSVDAIDMFKTAQSYVVDSSARASR